MTDEAIDKQLEKLIEDIHIDGYHSGTLTPRVLKGYVMSIKCVFEGAEYTPKLYNDIMEKLRNE